MWINPLIKRLAPFPPTASQILQKRNFNSEIFISRLSFYTTEQDLKRLFSRFGSIKQVRLIRDGKTQRVKGFAFIDYSSEDEARKAVKVMDGRILDGRLIFVEIADPRSAENIP
ncbi:uncharacterized protein A4U43_C05F3810 [Asparagus officinalis]|uniref:RRM domain-containing protein n=1 Tax=Asparagus officinalis TaxID=4686 RepID=A0A5P1ETC7_ASPOF|nr:glycine-rich RNA-binding protein 4, mitochondrial-like [Asparagus officinalis]ONK67791.1 uncharacterized protein A4U43_C05F3810 [Asparagus officinalis]